MKVGHWQELGLAFGQPSACGCTLAFWAVPVAAAVVGNGRVGAVLAARDMPAKRCCAATLDRRHHPQLVEADMAGIGSAPCGAMAAENIRDLQDRARHVPRQPGGRISLSLSAICSSGLMTCWIVLVATRV